MATTTAKHHIAVPQSTDDPNIPDDMTTMAQSIEGLLVGQYTSVSDRSTRCPSPHFGELGWLNDTKVLTVYNGTTWVQIYPPANSMTNGPTVPANTVGIDGDVFFKV